MNSYNIFDEKEPSCILFHAIAKDPIGAALLGQRAGHDLTGLTIELERENIRTEMGKDPEPSFRDARIGVAMNTAQAIKNARIKGGKELKDLLVADGWHFQPTVLNNKKAWLAISPAGQQEIQVSFPKLLLNSSHHPMYN